MQHPRLRSLVPLTGSLFLAVTLTIPSGSLAAPLQGVGTAPLAQIVSVGGRIEWLGGPEMTPATGLTLAVADPAGKVRTAAFAPGEPVSLSLIDSDGAALPDGVYTFELRTVEPIPEAVQAKLERARQAGNEGAVRRLEASLPQPRVQSGTFRIAAGALATEEKSEPTLRVANKDQLVPDDLIVDGKGCIGLGCAANETFGQEALRLKQSVVRLRLEDTSAQAGFPAGDWQLTANDAASGGVNRFSIDDLTAGTTPVTVRGGAPSNSLFVDAQGRLGVGTAVPAQRFHLLDSGTPSIRFEKTGGTPRTWDLAADASSFRLIDQSNSGAAPVQVAAGAPTNSVVVSSAGYLGIGVNPPTAPFHMVGNIPSNVTGRVQNTSATGYSGIEFLNHTGLPVFFFGVDNAGGFTRMNSIQNFPLVLMTESQQRLKIQADGKIALGGLSSTTNPVQHANGAYLSSGGTWTNASSRSLKQDIHTLDSHAALATFQGLEPVEFAYKADPTEHHVGFIAEDVPELVADKDRKGLSPMDIVAVLTKVVQDQQKEIAAQKDQVRSLEERLAALEAHK